MTHVYRKEIEGLHFDKLTLLFFIENSLAIYKGVIWRSYFSDLIFLKLIQIIYSSVFDCFGMFGISFPMGFKIFRLFFKNKTM